MSLSRDQILAADDLKREELDVPEWGGSVWLRMMTASERDNFEASVTVGGRVSQQNIRAKFAALVIVDEAGNRLFSEKDIITLGGKSAAALDRVLSAGQKLNGLTQEDVDSLGKLSEDGEAVSSPSS